MRITTRFAIVVALATAGALAVAGIAMPATSTVSTFNFAPNTGLSGGPTTPGALSLRTDTTYTPPARLKRARFWLDNDFTIDPSVTPTPRCNPALLSGNKTMAAMLACGDDLVSVPPSTVQSKTGSQANPNILTVASSPSTGRRMPPASQGSCCSLGCASGGTINCASPANNTQGNANCTVIGTIIDEAGGASGRLLRVHSDQGGDDRFELCQLSFSLVTGETELQGTFDQTANPNTFAIAGGTGIYRTAQGVVVADFAEGFVFHFRLQLSDEGITGEVRAQRSRGLSPGSCAVPVSSCVNEPLTRGCRGRAGLKLCDLWLTQLPETVLLEDETVISQRPEIATPNLDPISANLGAGDRPLRAPRDPEAKWVPSP